MICFILLKTTIYAIMLMKIHCMYLIVTFNIVKEKLYKHFEGTRRFYDNYVLLNPWKCNFMFLGSNLSVDEIFAYKNFKLKNTSVNEILGVAINNELEFNKYLKHDCKKSR